VKALGCSAVLAQAMSEFVQLVIEVEKPWSFRSQGIHVISQTQLFGDSTKRLWALW
jgi:hypothetical protein